MDETWARQWCEAMGSGDVERALAYYSPTATFEDVPFQMTAEGDAMRDAVAQFVGSGENSFAFRRCSGGPSGGAVEWDWTAAHSGPFLGVEAAGHTTQVRVVTVMSLSDDGLITSHCDYWDARTLLAQLG